MQKNKVSISRVICGLIIIVLGISVCVIINNYKDDEMNITTNKKVEKRHVLYIAEKSIFENSITCEGHIKIDEEKKYEDKMKIKYKDKSKVKIHYSIGDDIKANETVVTSDTKKIIKAKNDCKIIGVDFIDGDVVVTVLNYNKLNFTLNVEEKYIEQLNNNTKVYILENGSERVNGEIVSIGNIIKEGYIEVEVHINRHFYPGETRRIYIVLNATNEILAIEEEVIHKVNDKTFVLVKENGKYVEKSIQVGEKIQFEEEGEKYVYYEVLKGLEEGEEVYSESENIIEYGKLKEFIMEWEDRHDKK